LRDELRKRFRSEYLDQLSRRNKNSSTLIKEGDILLGHDNLKRLKLVISLGDQDIPKKRWYCTNQSKDCIWRIGAACSTHVAIGDMHEYSKDDGTKYGYNQAKQEHGIGTYYAR